MSSFIKIGFLGIVLLFISCQITSKKHVCPPCNSSCDTKVFTKGGNCPDCHMKLVLESEVVRE